MDLHPPPSAPLLPRHPHPHPHRWPLYEVDVEGHPPGDAEPEIACVHVLFGFCILASILCRDLAPTFPAFSLSPWDGLSFADLLPPFFLFALGAHIACSYSPTLTGAPLKVSAKFARILLRALQLFFLGIFLEGGFFHGCGDLAFGVNIGELRIMGFLQRVAVVLLVVGACHVAFSQRQREAERHPHCCSLCTVTVYHWQAALLVLIAYLALTFSLYVPDWEVQLPLQLVPAGAYTSSHHKGQLIMMGGLLPAPNVSSLTVPCATSASLSPACNAAGYIDRVVLGTSHMFGLPSFRNLPECAAAWASQDQLDLSQVPAWCLAPFEPCGLLSTTGSLLPSFLGLHFGHILMRCQTHGARLAQQLPLGILLSLTGWMLQFPLSLANLLPWSIPSWAQVSSPGMPFNLSLFSVSFSLFASGAACLILCAIYLLVDFARVRFYTRMLEWSGRNWLLLYSLVAIPVLATVASGFYWQQPENNLVAAWDWLLVRLCFHNQDAALLLGSLLKLLACGFASALLCWQRLTFSV